QHVVFAGLQGGRAERTIGRGLRGARGAGSLVGDRDGDLCQDACTLVGDRAVDAAGGNLSEKGRRQERDERTQQTQSTHRSPPEAVRSLSVVTTDRSVGAKHTPVVRKLKEREFPRWRGQKSRRIARMEWPPLAPAEFFRGAGNFHAPTSRLSRMSSAD